MTTRLLVLLAALVGLCFPAHGEIILLYTAETRGQVQPCPV